MAAQSHLTRPGGFKSEIFTTRIWVWFHGLRVEEVLKSHFYLSQFCEPWNSHVNGNINLGWPSSGSAQGSSPDSQVVLTSRTGEFTE